MSALKPDHRGDWKTMMNGALNQMTLFGIARRSVHWKLTAATLITTALALFAAGGAMFEHDLRVYRESWVSDLATQAAILALATAPAIAFDDKEGAERNLNSLSARPAVLAAAIYMPNGHIYASYGSGESAPTDHPPASHDATRISGERVEVTTPIIHDGEVLGTMYLRARYDIEARGMAYLGIFSVVMLGSMTVALFISSVLGRIITKPLDSMAKVARDIVENRSYSERAAKTTQDEVGVVVDAFNGMLDEVQARTRLIEESMLALKEEARVRAAAEHALELANARLESSMAAAEIGGFVCDLQTNQITADRNAAALFGLESDNALNVDVESLKRQVHPEDIAIVNAAETSCRDKAVLPSIEFRIVRPDGSIRWVTSRGKVQTDADGAALRLSALLIDVTDRKVAEQAVVQSERLYRAIGESIDYGVWVCDENGRNVYASDSFLRLTGISQEQCSAVGWTDVLHPDDLAATVTLWQESVRTGRPWYKEHRVRGTDGYYHPVLAQGVPIRDVRGQITGWAGINLDISRLKRTEAALREADRRKDEFLATLAHELRNPLAPIAHAVEIVIADKVDQHQRKWAQEIIARQVKRMALLLDDLLDVSRITQGKLKLRKEIVSLAVLLESVVETARPIINAKGHKFEIHIPANEVYLEVDPLRLSQALSNLLTNAAKYTDAEGSITLAVTVAESGISFVVKDNGIGIEQEVVPKLFEMFSQASTAIDRSEGGLGIGLSLVKGLIRLHGGTVTAKSEGIGSGSEFMIWLPVTSVAPARMVPELRDDGGAPAGDLVRKVLIADDNKDAAQVFALALSSSGYEVAVAYDGLEALEVGRGFWPDVVILDIGMPGLNGYEAARRVREEAWGKHTLLLAVTGWGQDDDKEHAKSAGFDHHFTKPVYVENIQAVLTEFFAGTRVRRASLHDGTGFVLT